jgi:predicted enzyme related to lactoylglutathione lyase
VPKTLRIFLLTALLAGCGTIAIDLPAVTDAPTGAHNNGRVVWHDLLTTTPEASREFYGRLFGWTFEKPGIDIGLGGDEDYMLIRHDGRLIGGMIDANTLNRDVNISQWVTMISVDDLDAAVERVTDNGGKILTQPTKLASRGSLAVLEGPTGELFAMLQTRDGDPPEYEPEMNGFLWDELWTHDVALSSRFYQRVLGYEPRDEMLGDSEESYRVLRAENKGRAGIFENPFKGERPVWVNYLRVENPAVLAAAAEVLGGLILVKAQPRDIGGHVAFIAGPSGAGIALQTWPLTSGDEE